MESERLLDIHLRLRQNALQFFSLKLCVYVHMCTRDCACVFMCIVLMCVLCCVYIRVCVCVCFKPGSSVPIQAQANLRL